MTLPEDKTHASHNLIGHRTGPDGFLLPGWKRCFFINLLKYSANSRHEIETCYFLGCSGYAHSYSTLYCIYFI